MKYETSINILLIEKPVLTPWAGFSTFRNKKTSEISSENLSVSGPFFRLDFGKM